MALLDIEDAASFLKISTETLRRKAQAGQMPGAKIGKGWTFIEEDLIKYVRAQYQGESSIYAQETNPNKGELICQSTNDQVKRTRKNMSGSSILRYQMEQEYENHLKRMIGKKQRDFMTN